MSCIDASASITTTLVAPDDIPAITGGEDGTELIRRSECFLNPAMCARDSTGSPHDEIPTVLLREYAKF